MRRILVFLVLAFPAVFGLMGAVEQHVIVDGYATPALTNTPVWQGWLPAVIATGSDGIVVPYTINCPIGAPISFGITASTSSVILSGTYQVKQ